MSQQKMALVQPLIEELFDLVMKEGYMNHNGEMCTSDSQMNPQIERLMKKLKMNQM